MDTIRAGESLVSVVKSDDCRRSCVCSRAASMCPGRFFWPAAGRHLWSTLKETNPCLTRIHPCEKSLRAPVLSSRFANAQVFFHIWEHNPGLLHKLAEQIQAASAAPAQVPEHSPELALVRPALV